MSANQNALSVVSSNISNADTTGYSRKQITSAEQVVQTGTTSAGTGVDLQEVRRARNVFLDQTYRRQNADSSYWETKSADFEDIQATLNEFSADDGSSDNGLQQTLLNFFNSWSDLSTDPSSQSSRQSVIEDADTLINTLQDMDDQLQQLQYDCAANVRDGVEQLNSLAQQVAKLNGLISQAELGGAEAGDLRDQRDTLLDQISSLANITVSDSSNGVFEVSIGGVSLVRGTTVRKLTAVGDGSSENPLTVQWADLGYSADITSGTIKAALEDCDQSSLQAIDAGSLPYNFSADSESSISNLRQGLNDMITTIADMVNELHSSGIDLDGNEGLDFFTAADSSQPLGIGNIQVNPELVNDLDKIVTSESGGSGDNTIAEQICQLTDEENFQFDGLSTDLNGFYQSLISWVSTEGETAGSSYDTQSTLVQQVDSQRQSISSVSLEEEMSKMITYQNAYNACAKVLSTVDSLLEELIQDLGSR